MKPVLDDALSSIRFAATSIDIRTIASIAFIAGLLVIAIYAMTVNPMDVTATISVPP